MCVRLGRIEKITPPDPLQSTGEKRIPTEAKHFALILFFLPAAARPRAVVAATPATSPLQVRTCSKDLERLGIFQYLFQVYSNCIQLFACLLVAIVALPEDSLYAFHLYNVYCVIRIVHLWEILLASCYNGTDNNVSLTILSPVMAYAYKEARERWSWINSETEGGVTILSPVRQQFRGNITLA
uniref:Uncharacterized protein n=1 Tax=Oryza meridionalis TaxID=40149 RepID=A0A0E0DUD1_9ORYZ